jgi:hypothetical protein
LEDTHLSDIVTTKKRAPLELAALDFAAVLNEIEESEGNIDHAIIQTFGELKLELADAVDRRIYFLQFLESQIEHVEKMEKAWKERRRILGNLNERIKESTKQTIVSAQGSLKLKGSTGELAVQKSPPSVRYMFEPARRSFEIVTDDIVSRHKIPAKYLQHVELLQLNKAAVKDDLLAGVELEFATVEKNNQHIRVRI